MAERDDLADRLNDAWAELRTIPLGGRGHLVDIYLEAAAAVRAAAIARVVAEYWRDMAMASDEPGVRIMAHPLACALEAFEGETEPRDLGVAPDHPATEAIRALAAERSGSGS